MLAFFWTSLIPARGHQQWLLQSSLVNYSEGCHFFYNRRQRCALILCRSAPPPDGRIKAFVMFDASHHFRVQAKLKELIERASSAADANLHRRIKPYPLGFAVRANGSKFAFRPENIEDNDTAVAHIRTLFLQHNVVCYVLTLGAVSEGKQYVLFSAEDESGPMMVGQRQIITQPAPHLGPLEIIESNFAEGRFVGLLPRQATPRMQ